MVRLASLTAGAKAEPGIGVDCQKVLACWPRAVPGYGVTKETYGAGPLVRVWYTLRAPDVLGSLTNRRAMLPSGRYCQTDHSRLAPPVPLNQIKRSGYAPARSEERRVGKEGR